ncbi:cell wall metabolism sensor histidine kinase WalK [Anaeromyxobacter sp. Fw109-5]|uniref:sensor histidine kinase n=1 Tax=Anaeromyxobacter sp. (strain Fw109-5) TaxID=404589 RepID=UPI0000ED793E|nr:ATP-binding protein [Anaeromyxobacter sp. Fw109-5]ABS24631.1 PAS/PAC sensor signal transduction histidine kinase [Anaeromyxobacter sp. Fw109-5]
MFGRTPLAAAIQALRAELAGGPRADLGRDVRELADLLSARAQRRPGTLYPEAPEQELLAALPDAAALVSREGWVRVSNAAFDTLAATGRAAGLTPLEITRSAELSEAVRRALEGTARRLDLQLGRRSYLVHLAPLLRGEVLLSLRDVTEARRAEATRRDFVANASHELRTPVAAIRAAAETLLAGAVDDPAGARQFVEIVARQAERLARLTEDLLDLSRLESRQWSFDLAPVDAAAVSTQAVELLALTARDKGLEIAAEVPAGATVRADARALEQVLVNLLDNAVKYTGEGEVTLRGERDGDAWVLSVADTGPGIDRHHLPRIFERFYRIDAGRSREQGGSGVGLAIVKHLVQGMGGEVGVESGTGGTRFWVRLPAV